MDGISVRPASAQDVEAIFSIRTSVVENHLSREQMIALGITPEAVAGMIAAGPCAWVAEIDGVAGGFAMIEADSLFALFVRPEFEGRGLARLLLAEAEAELFSRHSTIWLETSAQSRAARFYRAHGWTVTETLEDGDLHLEKQRHAAG